MKTWLLKSKNSLNKLFAILILFRCGVVDLLTKAQEALGCKQSFVTRKRSLKYPDCCEQIVECVLQKSNNRQSATDAELDLTAVTILNTSENVSKLPMPNYENYTNAKKLII